MDDNIHPGERGAREGVNRAARGAGPEWCEAAFSAIERCARTMPDFTTDALWLGGLEQPEEPRALGSIMRRAAAAGLIEKTDRVRKSDRPVCHRNPKAVWRSLVFGAS